MNNSTSSILVAPSILAADFGRLAQQINDAESAGADWIHCDIMDGHYVPNLTFGPMIVKLLKGITSLPLDVHLMITNPEQSMEWYIDAGADWVSVHPETCKHLHRTLRKIQELGAKAGVVLNPGSPLKLVDPVIDVVDLILIMSVNPGFGGQDFIQSAYKRLRAMRDLIAKSGRDIRLSVDGGISPDNARGVVDAGADVLVAGNAIFKDGPSVTIPKFRDAIGM